MVENLTNLHVVAVNEKGEVHHTIRSPGGWTPFELVPNLPDRAVDVACVRRVRVPPETQPATEGLWILIAFENSPPQLRIRSETGTFGTIPGNVLPLPIARRVAVTVSLGQAPANDPIDPGGGRAYVHLVVVADGALPQDRGRLIAAIMPNRGPGGFSSAIAEVQTSGAGDLGAVRAVALAPGGLIDRLPGQESAASLAAAFEDNGTFVDGALFFTRGGVSASGATGQWVPFRARDVAPPAGPGARPGPAVDVALAQSSISSAITDLNDYVSIVRGGGDADIYGASRSSSSNAWTGWENFEIFRAFGISIDTEPGQFSQVDMSKTTEGLHVIGVTNTGQLLHQLRTPGLPGTAIFRDVEVVGVGQDIGTVTAAACG